MTLHEQVADAVGPGWAALDEQVVERLRLEQVATRGQPPTGRERIAIEVYASEARRALPAIERALEQPPAGVPLQAIAALMAEFRLAAAMADPALSLAEVEQTLRALAGSWAAAGDPARQARLEALAAGVVRGRDGAVAVVPFLAAETRPAPLAAPPPLLTPPVAAPAPAVPAIAPHVVAHEPIGKKRVIIVASVLAVVSIGGVGVRQWLVKKAEDEGKKRISAAAKPYIDELEEHEGRDTYEDEGDMPAAVPEDKAAEPGAGAAIPAPPLVEVADAAPVDPSTREFADSAQTLVDMQHAALATHDFGLYQRTIDADTFHWGVGAADVFLGRDASGAGLQQVLDDLRRRDAISQIEPVHLTIGLAPDGQAAWIIDEFDWSFARPGKKASKIRYLTSEVAVVRDGHWTVVASMWAKSYSDRRVNEAASLAPMTLLTPVLAADEVRDDDDGMVATMRGAWVTPDAIAGSIAEVEGVASLGSAGELASGTAEVAKRYRRLAGWLFLDGPVRFGLAPGGQSGWVAANVDLLLSSKKIGELVLPYRMLAFLVKTDSGWRIAMLHFSTGGPLPDPPRPLPEGAPGDAGNPAPLTPLEVRDGLEPVREAVNACNPQHGEDGQPVQLAKVRLVLGVSGAVDEAHVEGELADTPRGLCVEAAVKAATFRPHGAPQTVVFPFRL